MITLDARLTALSSSDLLCALDRVASQGRELTADLVALLAECDERKLYAVEGYESLFEFCVSRLRLSESQAYHRIQAARAARRFPLVLERLRAGRVTLTTVALLREHLTEANHQVLLDWAEGKRKRDVEVYVRGLDPRPDVPFSLRRLAVPRAVALTAAERPGSGRQDQPVSSAVVAPAVPSTRASSPTDAIVRFTAAEQSTAAAPSPTGEQGLLAVLGASAAPATVAPVCPSASPASRALVRPLAPGRYSLHVTIAQETYDKLRRAQDLLAHDGGADHAVVLDRALTVLVAQLERRKVGAPLTQPSDTRSAKSRRAAGGVKPTAAKRSEPIRTVGSGGAGVARDAARSEVGTPQHGDPADSVERRPPSPPAVRRAGRSRYIPAGIRRAVWDRDGARCAYVSAGGVRCGATARLEFHHRVPFAEGGPASVENLSLACHRHNAMEAERWFNFDQ